MQLTLNNDDTKKILEDLAAANAQFKKDYPGDSSDRQPVHTVYGGANLFKAGSAKKLGSLGQRALDTFSPNFSVFADILGFPGADRLPGTTAGLSDLQAALEKDAAAVRATNPDAWLAHTIYDRVVNKLATEPIEDSRIDFEDGYGNRPDEEEDGHAISASLEAARAMEEGTIPPFIGIRIKPFTEECRQRGFRTLDLFLTNLNEKSGGKLPDNFVVTLPKVTIPDQVSALARLLEKIEEKTDFTKGSLKLEIMIETTQSIISRGICMVPLLVAAGEGRCTSAIFGTYDYTATCNITAAHQTHTHAACDFARHAMQVSLAGTGVNVVDGATTIMPIGPHKAPKGESLTPQQMEENRVVVNSAWKITF